MHKGEYCVGWGTLQNTDRVFSALHFPDPLPTPLRPTL